MTIEELITVREKPRVSGAISPLKFWMLIRIAS